MITCLHLGPMPLEAHSRPPSACCGPTAGPYHPEGVWPIMTSQGSADPNVYPTLLAWAGRRPTPIPCGPACPDRRQRPKARSRHQCKPYSDAYTDDRAARPRPSSPDAREHAGGKFFAALSCEPGVRGHRAGPGVGGGRVARIAYCPPREFRSEFTRSPPRPVVGPSMESHPADRHEEQVLLVMTRRCQVRRRVRGRLA